jgi:hypothetical protein
MTWIRTIAAIVAMGCAAVSPADADSNDRQQMLIQLGTESEEQLHERLDRIISTDTFQPDSRAYRDVYEPCLSEIIRRSTAEGAAVLQQQLDALVARSFPESGDPDFADPGSHYNLELLIALRRAKGQPDPLTILVEHGDGPLNATELFLPRLKVSIKNVDVENNDVGFRFGGDYRTGRQARWRIDVIDEDGKWVPTKRSAFGMRIAGGLFRDDVLKHGEAWETELDLRQFIEAPPPGRYQLQVLYHNTRTIVDLHDLTGLIVCRSQSIPLVISQTVIHLSEQQKLSAGEWIAALDETKPLEIVAGTYGEWVHEHVPPESSAGRLLRMGLSAALPMIEALQDESISDEKRAWILSLLFSATGHHDPAVAGALGSYSYHEGPWEVLGKRPDEEPGSGGIGFASSWTSSGGKLNPDRLQDMTNKWTEWLQTVEVKGAEEE